MVDNYEMTRHRLLCDGFKEQHFTYKTPDDEDYQTIFVKGDEAIVYSYYYHDKWASFKYSDASFLHGLPNDYTMVNI